MPVTPAQLPNNAVDFLTATLNSVGATKSLSAQIATMSKGTQAERPLQLTSQTTASLQDQVNQIFKYLRGIQYTFNNPSTPSLQATVLNVTLVPATTTAINSIFPTNEGDQLWAFVLAKGNTALLSWGVAFKFAGTEFDSTTDTTTVFKFVGRKLGSQLYWYMDSLPLTGQT